MASKVKGNRLVVVGDKLQQIWSEFKENPESDAHLEQIVAALKKLHQLLTGQEKCCQDVFTKDPGMVLILYEMIKYFCGHDLQLLLLLLGCVHHFILHGKGLNHLYDTGVLQVLCESFITSICSLPAKENIHELWIAYLTLINLIGTKEKRFATVLRLSGVFDAALQLLTSFHANHKVLLPILQLLQNAASSSVNVCVLIKSSVIETIIEAYVSCGKKRSLLNRVCLDLMTTICKTKIGCKKAVKLGIVPLMLASYQEWHRSDHRNRQLLVRKSILNVIKACTASNCGRKAFDAVDGYRTIYFLGLEGIESKDLDGVIRIMIAILRCCTPHNNLLVKRSGMVFPLPNHSESDNTTQNDNVYQSCESVMHLDKAEEKKKSQPGDVPDLSDNSDGDESDVDNDDHAEDDAYEEKDQIIVKKSSAESFNSCSITSRRHVDADFNPSLYDAYFQELNEFIEVTKSSYPSHSSTEHKGTAYLSSSLTERRTSSPREDVGTSIWIPTADTTEQEYLSKSEILNQSDEYNGSVFGVTEEDTEQRLTCSLCHLSRKTQSLCLNHQDKNCSCKVLNGCLQTIHSEKIKYNSAFPLIQANSTQEHLQIGSKLSEERVVKDEIASNGTQSISNVPVNEALEHVYAPVKHVLPFVADTSPSTFGHFAPLEAEPLLEKKQYLNRLMLFQDFARIIFKNKVVNRVVYDLDAVIKLNEQNEEFTFKEKSPTSIKNIGKNIRLPSSKRNKSPSRYHHSSPSSAQSSQSLSTEEILKLQPLSFESRFESGNLRKAIQIRQYEYDLILNPDINNNHHHQWFFFQVTNMEADVDYRFNIINCEKGNSQFNFGMQPVLYSRHNASSGSPGWERSGTNVCYFKNYFVKEDTEKTKNYFTATFTINFPFQNDTCYLAYHYPYTVSMLYNDLQKFHNILRPHIYFRSDRLCETLSKNGVILLTITSVPSSEESFTNRPFIMLTARVHPGESNSSWIMKGVIDYLLSDAPQANLLRSAYVFKIVPMLNPDGVINGSHRCSLSGQDLNRQWKDPSMVLHPSIYHTKNIIKWMKKNNKKPLVFVDFHGHSRKKNVFMYGCIPRDLQTSESSRTCQETLNNDEDVEDLENAIKLLPCILNELAPCFSLHNCAFTMDKSKESTARVVGFRDLDVTLSYTMESTYCGMDQGPYKGNQMGTRELEEMGRYFCLALLRLKVLTNT